MRRCLVVSLALLAIARTPAAAQTCMGMASFAGAPMQVTAYGQFTGLANSFGATVGYGTRSAVYGTVGISTTSYESIDGSTLGLGARAGYQISLGRSQLVHLCPNASFGIGVGPHDDAAGIDQSTRSATLGLNLGTDLGGDPRLKVAPSVGLSYAHDLVKAENDAGTTLFEISEGYALAQLSVGVILNSKVSIRSGVDIPLGRESTDPTFNLTLGYNFGGRRK